MPVESREPAPMPSAEGDLEPAFREQEVRLFLQWVPPGRLALTSFDAPADDRQRPKATRLFNLPGDLEAAVTWAAEQNAAERNVYFTPNEVRADFQGRKPSKDDITSARFAWADADPACSAADPGAYAAARAKVLSEATARASGIGASACVSTGNGVQVFLKLAGSNALSGRTTKAGKPVPREQVVLFYEETTARFAHAFDGTAKIDAVQNIDRLMRLPGTVNFADRTKLAKGYPRATQASILALSDRCWTPKEVRKKFPALPATAAVAKGEAAQDRFAEDVSPLDEGERLALQEKFELERHSDVFLQARWEGKGIGLADGSRSGLDLSLGSMLKARGYSYREMRALLMACPGGAGAEKAEEGDERYFRRIWAASGSGVSVEEVKEHLTDICLDAPAGPLPTEAWAKAVYDARLEPVALDEILTFVAETLRVGGKRAVNAAWKEFFKTASRSYQEARAKDRTALVAGKRIRIPWSPLDYNGMLREIEAAMLADPEAGDLLRVDQTFVRVVEDVLPGTTHPDDTSLPPPKQVHFVPMSKTAMFLRIEESVCLVREREKGLVPIEVPEHLPKMMLELPSKTAPRVEGLLQHPAFTPEGRLIFREGLDEPTGRFVAFGGWKFPELKSAPTRDDAVRAATRIRELVLSETMLRDRRLDGGAVIAGHLAGLSRKLTPQGPIVVVNAHLQGTGKTTLARQLHVTLTGRDMAVQAMSPDSNEFQKQALAILLRSPAMCCFDNVKDGTLLDSSQLAGLVTLPHFSGRVLGVSADVTVPTNVLWLFTGNALKVDTDLIRRTILVDLLATEAKPAQHRYSVPDPVRHAKEVRAEVVACLLTIQSAWFRGGERAEGPSFGLGAEFDRLVTWPLAYAGEFGLFEKQAKLEEESPTEQARTSTLVALAGVFGEVQPGDPSSEREFTATEAVRRINGGSNQQPFGKDDSETAALRALRDAIEAADRRRVHSPPALGQHLGTLVDQPPRHGLILRSRVLHGVTRYRVERGGVGGV